jgi:hypothetical protein
MSYSALGQECQGDLVWDGTQCVVPAGPPTWEQTTKEPWFEEGEWGAKSAHCPAGHSDINGECYRVYHSDEEYNAYLEQAFQEGIARGLTPTQARAEAKAKTEATYGPRPSSTLGDVLPWLALAAAIGGGLYWYSKRKS